ncbi:uncharacterized protein LOC142570547 [Dermacentor variabilis]|uniref:uncharacterized protein LOC142570547 n=1 Tax=Dermacentor variabilis TaxID=34621 RepID=UPI003F5C0253
MSRKTHFNERKNSYLLLFRRLSSWLSWCLSRFLIIVPPSPASILLLCACPDASTPGVQLTDLRRHRDLGATLGHKSGGFTVKQVIWQQQQLDVNSSLTNAASIFSGAATPLPGSLLRPSLSRRIEIDV